MVLEKKVRQYIKEHWGSTICESRKSGFIKMVKPYSTPCADDRVFADFYYWDTYFANLGLMRDGRIDQAENNLDIMAFFIEKLGYVPNSDKLLNRTQPPLFTRGVYDLYTFTGDKRIIEKYIEYMVKELYFFRNDRMTPCGLNAYRHNATKTYLKNFYDEMVERVGLKKEKNIDKLVMSGDLLSIAESGWDFNPRFMTETNRFAASEFAHLDLNCLLYDAEAKISKMAEIIGDQEKAVKYAEYADRRKILINTYMLDKKSGVYYDYNFQTDTLSKVVSCASLYPYALGVSEDAEGAKKVLEKLELPFGIAACEDVEDEERFQWGYPSMWPSNVYFGVTALLSVGLQEDAKRIAQKYVDCVERVFEQTGSLWEKYDAELGNVSVTQEYETPEMMGWTAGTYLYFKDIFNK